MLMEEPYGFFGALNPTGHTAIYFSRICAESPIKLRRCAPGELGAVIARYQGIAGYDWIAIPLVPYLYSVEDAAAVPQSVDTATVERMRDRYHEGHLLSLGPHVFAGNLVHGGWTQLVGAAYMRRIYAFRFETTEEQDDALIARLNSASNRSHFSLTYNNCADFARTILNAYFPHKFRRNIFPDAGMTTPKQIAYKLERYARKHPEMHLTVYEIPQVPGYRSSSRSNKTVAASLVMTGYAIPIALVNPYIAGGLFVDYLVRGSYHLIPLHPQLVGPENLMALTAPAQAPDNAGNAGMQATSATADGLLETSATEPSDSGLRKIETAHE